MYTECDDYSDGGLTARRHGARHNHDGDRNGTIYRIIVCVYCTNSVPVDTADCTIESLISDKL